MPVSEKGDNSAKYLQNFVNSSSSHLHLRHNLWARYHDPSSSGSPIITMTRCHGFIMQKSKKGRKSDITLQWQVRREKKKRKKKKTKNKKKKKKKKKKKTRDLLIFMHIPCIKLQDPISNRSWPYAKHYGQIHVHTQTDRQAKPICPLNIFEVSPWHSHKRL